MNFIQRTDERMKFCVDAKHARLLAGLTHFRDAPSAYRRPKWIGKKRLVLSVHCVCERIYNEMCPLPRRYASPSGCCCWWSEFLVDFLFLNFRVLKLGRRRGSFLVCCVANGIHSVLFRSTLCISLFSPSPLEPFNRSLLLWMFAWLPSVFAYCVLFRCALHSMAAAVFHWRRLTKRLSSHFILSQCTGMRITSNFKAR